MLDLNKEYGVVLAGGGARGAYQVGAWKALRECKIKIKGVAGTSVGALNGAMIVQNQYEKALEIWRNIRYSRVVSIEDEYIEKLKKFDYKEIDFFDFFERLKNIASEKGVDVTPLKKLIDEMIDEKLIRKSDIDYGLVTISITDRKPLELFLDDIKEGELTQYLLASAYLPGFKSEKINGKRFLDGGFYNRTPINMLIDKGYSDIIVVRLTGFGIDRKVNSEKVNIIDVYPTEDLGGMVEFDAERAKYNIDLGYYDTLKTIYSLKGKVYYINCKKTERYFISRFMKLGKRTKNKLVKHNLLDNLPLSRNYIEQGLPNLARKLKMQKNWQYYELAISIIEAMASILQIEKFKVYEYEEIVKMIQDELPVYMELVSYKPTSKELEHIMVDIIKVL